MDLKKPLLSLGLLALSANALAATVPSAPAPAPVSMGLEAGSTVFFVRGSEDMANGTMSNKGVFCGMRAEMEFVLPKAYHVSVLGVYAPGSQTSSQSVSNDLSSAVYQQSYQSYLWQVEAKAGKMLEVNSFSLLPHLVGGWYHTTSSVGFAFPEATSEMVSETKMDWKYAGVGMMASYSFSPNFSVALGGKVMKHIIAEASITNNDFSQAVDLGSDYGYEVYMPVKVWLGPQSSWYVHAEPFMLKVDLEKDVTIYGGRFSLQKAF